MTTGHRFASGELDEAEYWRRLSVLGEEFGRHGQGRWCVKRRAAAG
jgi:hypothetical protein